MPRPVTPSYPARVTTSPSSMLTPAKTIQPLIGSDYSFNYAPVRRARARFPHLPALDGLRGLAVAAVLAFHGGWRLTSGGFLGVSTFFTLSGFLITARLVHEHTETDTINLRAFWGRRVRRLIPAAVLAVALVVALAASVVPAFRTNLIGDVTAALTEVANWRFWLAGRSYTALFRQPSPLLHFWSLAIEEQFYIVFPIIVWFVLVKLRRTRATLTTVVTIMTIVCALTSLWAGVTGRHTLAYYGTPMRAAEILTGALLALLPIGRPSQQASRLRSQAVSA
jgi:peptidoglycan/LPS O-acetylase OafA/YrhL